MAKGSDSTKGFIVDITALETEAWTGKYETVTGKPTREKVFVPVSEVLIQALFSPQRNISQASGGVICRRIADKIVDAENTVTLNEDEYTELLKAIKEFPGFRHYEFAIVDRVQDAKETSLKPSSK